MKGNALLERARASGRGGDGGSGRGQPAPTAGVVRQPGARPPGRAVIGGLLVAIAAVGAFVLATPDESPALEYVVADHAVAPGTRLQPSDLTTIAADLPPELARLAFTDASGLDGAVALGPLTRGQLVQRGAVAQAPLASFEVSLSLDADRALDGHLGPGERVAVLATYGSGPDAVTITIASDALVERVSQPTGLAVGTAELVTLGLGAELDVQAVVHAARSGELTLVRAESATNGLTYQAPTAVDLSEPGL